MDSNQINEAELRKEEDELFKSIDGIKIPLPSNDLKTSILLKIDQMHNQIQFSNTKIIRIYLKIASFAAVFLIGWFIGTYKGHDDDQILNNMQNQLDQNSNLLVLNLLQQSSVSDRLQAANVTYSIANLNEQVVNALIYSLENDSDPNVRIKCAEAISMHFKPDSLFKIYTKALNHQNEPYLQLMLINLIASLNTQESKLVLTNYLKSNKLDEFVRSEIIKTITL